VSLTKIEILSPGSHELYDDFLTLLPETLIYHSSKFKQFLQDLLGCQDEYLLALEDGKIRGALPLMFVEFEGRRVYNSLPFYGSNGGIVADSDNAAQLLASTYAEIARAQTTISATIVTNPFTESTFSALPHNLTDERISQFTRLSSSADFRDQLMSRIDSSARRNIHKAQREGIIIEIDHALLPRLREMHQANILAIGGLPKPERFFTLIPKHFAPGRDFDLYVAKKDGTIVAALLLFYFNQTVEYITPAIDSDYRSYQPLSLILIEAMIDACKRGYTRWNWGGTWNTQMGVYRFKKKWAAAECRYRYYVQLNDESVLQWPQEKILKTFPNFYVAPFSALKQQKEVNVG